MLDHEFTTIAHWAMGPCIGKSGCVYYVAHIDEIWILRCGTPSGLELFRYYADYETLICDLKAIDTLH